MNHASREQRKRRIRAKIRGTAERPRASVFRSNTRLTVQLIDDVASRTLISASGAPDTVGSTIGEAAKKLGVDKIVFDRGGYRYHGRVKAVAEAMRASGLKF
ncbi:MAG: 50S ribosomal protein L18 [Candidatus Andersenbacteria bacterium]|nr:50S ribosomal protein L18 [Candidatus Andersenbacteria bacterium]MBI3251056.1 50S ribosomal protein L18 [Candidatus Andersenbacteria bacterium]